MMQILY